jgi:HAD superfamily hydrolase (TIGR01450 family)
MPAPPIRALVLDLDGVVYLEHDPLPGAARAIAALRRRGFHVLFATNNASQTRRGFARRLTAMGIPCRPDELMNASFAAAARLRRRFPRGSVVFTFGNGGLARELKAAGLAPVWCHTRAAWRAFRGTPPPVRAVAVAYNASLTFWDLCAAHLALQRGAELWSCNLDPTYPARGMLLPGTGSLARLLETASGQRSRLIGKPDPALFRALLREHGLSPREVLVVGDRADVDLKPAKALGARTALVLTGVDTPAAARRVGVRPDWIVRDLPALVRLPALRRRQQDSPGSRDAG